MLYKDYTANGHIRDILLNIHQNLLLKLCRAADRD